MMETHILNGDALAEKFPIAGDVIVCREALIDGPVQARGEQFWKERATYLTDTYNADETTYFVDVKTEFEKLSQLRTQGLNLWFEHDLFCQVNMWFVIHSVQLYKIQIPLFRVMPPPDMLNVWSGFGRMNTADLQNCFSSRMALTDDETKLGVSLWEAFREHDFESLRKLSSVQAPAYPYLKEVCEAHIERFSSDEGRPQKSLRAIKNSGLADFHDIFKAFSKTEGIYGFGDLQVREMLASL
jgi:hypothetical protein